MLLPQQETARRETFGYLCRACSRCCPHKLIQVNPYEVARLARVFGMTTGEFRAAYTEKGGAILKRTEDDVCVFLSPNGCLVHGQRPLVCRLYPLGRRVAPDGSEEWLHTEPHPLSEGQYTGEGTIADYIAAQGALPYMQAADAYADWVRQAEALGNGEAEAEADGSDLIDMDGAIAAYCAQSGVTEPSDIEDRRVLHLKILYRHLDGGNHD